MLKDTPVCGGRSREQHIYTSLGNIVEIHVISAEALQTREHFMLYYEGSDAVSRVVLFANCIRLLLFLNLSICYIRFLIIYYHHEYFCDIIIVVLVAILLMVILKKRYWIEKTYIENV